MANANQPERRRPTVDNQVLASVGVDPRELPAEQPVAAAADPAATESDARSNRRPFGVAQAKLNFPPARPGFAQRVFNDTPGRIQRAIEGGYSHRKAPDGKPYSAVVGVNQDGSGMVGYLMEIPREWYDEDQREKQKVNDRIDESIKRGNIQGKVGQDGRYIPAEGIKITSSR